MPDTKNNAPDAHTARAVGPLDILAKEGCKVQSLTVSDQHATLLVSYAADGESQGADAEAGANEHLTASEAPAGARTVSSLLKLTVVPFHKALLGSNPVISPDDIERGQMSERNLLRHDPKSSEEIIRYLRRYSYQLKSESGAEYSYYAARPSSELCAVSAIASGAKRKQPDGDGQSDKSSGASSEADATVDGAASNFGAFDVELISPASAYQISRSMPSLGHVLVRETPEIYSAVVKPYIQTIVDGGSLSWIQNLIDLKKEKERLICNHDEFIINVDTKWRTHPPPLTTPRAEWKNHPSTADLYCLGIVKRQGITCLRDLRGEHVSLLKQMEEEGLNAIRSVYGVDADQIRVFVHYQPQFYHFHVHFTRLENEVGCSVERGHLLCDIIQNLELDSEYYCKRTITYKLAKGAPLQNLIENNCNQNE